MAQVKSVLVTGAKGFIGSNLMLALSVRDDLSVTGTDADTSGEKLESALATAEVIVHLAGVNRPLDPAEFDSGNRGLTQQLCDRLVELGRGPKIVMTSSIQAELDNPYGLSKRAAEEALAAYADRARAEVLVLRLPNVFGKWSRPNYNSAVATFCHNTWRGIPLEIHDPAAPLRLVHVDDVVASLVGEIDAPPSTAGVRRENGPKPFETTVGELASLITGFPAVRDSGVLPELGDRFTACLYSTFLSYAPHDALSYSLQQKRDERGVLAEFIKSEHVGQIFISRTLPGVTRGNHYHHCKVEKFLVVEGSARVEFRHLDDDSMVTVHAAGTDLRVVDIPPGYTHSISNIGDAELVVLFWASEIFDPARPDTYFAEVHH